NSTVGAGMITGGIEQENLQPVSAEERAVRFSQTATAIALNGSTAKDVAYQLERKLFDNGHASTVLETQNTSLIVAVKNAGLICLCVNYSDVLADIIFDCDAQAMDDIYNTLKDRKIIY
ncbi:MAG: sulfate adenylyltransferase subunit CysN, partial [Methylobacter sp.]|nr:sulfate adenylyltransferase subunit CysN [Methylobacter sp.]